MSVRQVFEWRCDTPGCEAVAIARAWQMPSGWGRSHYLSGSKDRCPAHRSLAFSPEAEG